MKVGIVTVVLLNLALKLTAAGESIETDTKERNNEAVANCHAQARLNFDNCVLWNPGTNTCKEELAEFLKRCLPRHTRKKKKNAHDNTEEYTRKTKMCHAQADLNFDQCVIWSLSVGSCENQRAEYLNTCLPRKKLKKRTGVKSPTTLLQVASIFIRSFTADQSNSKEGGPEKPIISNGDTAHSNDTTETLTNQSSTVLKKGLIGNQSSTVLQKESTVQENTTQDSSLDILSTTLSLTEKDRATASNQSSTTSIDKTTSLIQDTTKKSRIIRHNLKEQSSGEDQLLWPWLQTTEDDVTRTTDKFSFLESIVDF